MTTYTPNEIAKMLRVSRDKVMTWIRNGELPAFNSATSTDTNLPRYLVTDEWLQAFLERRKVVAEPKKQRRTKCPAEGPGFIKFF